MKKNLILLVLSLFFTQAALAETTIPWTKEGCESVKGKWITAHASTEDGCDAAHCNGRNFCQSPQTMNWWSALIWCKSIGRELATTEDACPNGLSSGNTCANLKGKAGWVWLGTPLGGSTAYDLHSNGGFPSGHYQRSYASWHAALCK